VCHAPSHSVHGMGNAQRRQLRLRRQPRGRKVVRWSFAKHVSHCHVGDPPGPSPVHIQDLYSTTNTTSSRAHPGVIRTRWRQKVDTTIALHSKSITYALCLRSCARAYRRSATIAGGQHVASHKAMPLQAQPPHVRVLRQRLIHHQRRHLCCPCASQRLARCWRWCWCRSCEQCQLLLLLSRKILLLLLTLLF
jgi:hypothetical protein